MLRRLAQRLKRWWKGDEPPPSSGYTPLTVTFDEKTLQAIEKLRDEFRVSTPAAVVRRSLALARVCVKLANEKGEIRLVDAKGNIHTLSLRHEEPVVRTKEFSRLTEDHTPLDIKQLMNRLDAPTKDALFGKLVAFARECISFTDENNVIELVRPRDGERHWIQMGKRKKG